VQIDRNGVAFESEVGDMCLATDEFAASFRRETNATASGWQWSTHTRRGEYGLYERIIDGVVRTSVWTGRIHIVLNNGPESPLDPNLRRRFKSAFSRAIERCASDAPPPPPPSGALRDREGGGRVAVQRLQKLGEAGDPAAP
jgi:hypothetical protein